MKKKISNQCRKVFLALIILILCQDLAFAQKEANNWFFGFHMSIDFNGPAPVVDTTSPMLSWEGCASISDENGNLLFYTNGDTVYNKNHQIMTKGINIGGGWSSAQSSIIIKKPCDKNIYYIFTTGERENWGSINKGLRYTIVDMSLQGGLGEVVQKNIPLHSPITERLAAVKHANGEDIWVVSHEFQTNNFLAHLVTSNGVSTNPVISSVGSPYGSTLYIQRTMKFAPDGSKLASNVHHFLVEVFEFDNATGILSNPVKVDLEGTYSYSLEFSPNGNLLYYDVTKNNGSTNPNDFTRNLYQVDMTKGWDSISFHNNKTDLGVSNPNPTWQATYRQSLQLAPDGKIYIHHGHVVNNYIGAINDPNVVGSGCNYNDSALFAKKGVGNLGFPNFIASYFYDAPFIFSGTCFGNTTTFSLGNGFSADSVKWDFGDTASVNNTSTTLPTSHIYSSPGLFTTTLIIYKNGTTDTFQRKVNIYQSISEDFLGADTVLCKGDLKLEIDIPCSSNLWSTGNTSKFITVTQPGVYWVEVTGRCGIISDTIVVDYTNGPAIVLPADTTICTGDSITLTATSTESNYLWNTGDTTSSIYVGTNGTFWVSTQNSCGIVADTIEVFTVSLPVLDLPDTTICKGDEILITIPDPANEFNFLWNNGQNNNTINLFEEGPYWVEASKNGCIVSDTAYIILKDCSDKIPDAIDDEFLVAVPNAFSPNGDGLSDNYQIMIKGEILELNLVVFNRWGKKVFESNDVNSMWDGKCENEDQPVGVYVYMLYVRGTHQEIKKKGNITLLR